MSGPFVGARFVQRKDVAPVTHVSDVMFLVVDNGDTRFAFLGRVSLSALVCLWLDHTDASEAPSQAFVSLYVVRVRRKV